MSNLAENHENATVADQAEARKAALSPDIDAQIAERDRVVELTKLPLVVLADGRYYIKPPYVHDYKHRPKNDREFRVKLKHLYPTQIIPGIYDKGDQLFPNEALLPLVSKVAESVTYDFSATACTYDLHKDRLTHGYKMGYEGRFGAVEPRQDLNVEDWLRELFGGTDRDLQGAYEWIAATHQKHINKLSTALVLAGAGDGGKSLFAMCLAKTWGVSTAVQMGNSLERFNGTLMRCPIWHADESLPSELTPTKFKDLVQRREHEIELKGQEKQTLRGCPRLIITLNELDDFKIGVASGPDSLKAVGDRLSVYKLGPKIADMASGVIQDGEAKIDLIVGHLLWVQLNHEPKAQRFLGGGFGVDSIEVLTQRAADQHPEVFEALRDFCRNPCAWEDDYAVNHPFKRGAKYPLVSQSGRLFVNFVELAGRIGGKVTAQDARKALGQFSCRGDRTLRVGEHRGGYYELDGDKLQTALGVDLLPVLAHDTGTRTPTSFEAVRQFAIQSYCERSVSEAELRRLDDLDPDGATQLH